jgi:hypothetical protein
VRTLRPRSALLSTCLLAGAALGAGGCVKNPPVYGSTPVATPAVPSLPAEPEAMTLGWLRAHETLRMLERLGVENPAGAAAAAGVDVSVIDPKRPFVVLAGAPQGEGAEGVPVLAWLPVPAESGLAMFATGVAREGLTPVAGGVAFNVNGTAVPGSGSRALLDRLVAGPLGADVEAFVQVEAIVKHWRAAIDAGFTALDGLFATPLPNGKPAMQPAMARAYRDWLKKMLDTQGTLLLGFGAGEQDLTAYGVTSGPAASVQPWPATVAAMPDLAGFVPPGDLRLEWRLQPDSPMLQFTLDLYEQLLAGHPAELARMKSAFRTWMGVPMQMAMSMSVDAEVLYRGVAVSHSANASEQFKAAADMGRLMGEPAMKEALSAGGIGTTLKVDEHAREVDGRPVLRIEYTIDSGVDPDIAAANPALARLAKMSIAFEMVQLGEYLVYSLNGLPQDLERTAADLLAGERRHPSLVARTREPAGGDVYFDLDLPAMLRHVRAFVPEELRGGFPAFEADWPVVTSFGLSTPTRGYYRSTVPRAVLTGMTQALRAAATGGHPLAPEPAPAN